MELGNLQFNWELAKVFTIEIQIAIAETLVFYAYYSILLLTKVISNISRLTYSRASGID
jgi:hypothetical protein